MVTNILTLQEAEAISAVGVHLTIDPLRFTAAAADRMVGHLWKNPGSVRVFLHDTQTTQILQIKDDLRVNVNVALKSVLATLPGILDVEVTLG